jgi:hypothetical protein
MHLENVRFFIIHGHLNNVFVDYISGYIMVMNVW